MTDNGQHFIIIHNLHQASTNTNASVAASKRVHVDHIIHLKIQIETFDLDIFRQICQTLSHRRFRSGNLIMRIHPLDILASHGSHVLVRQSHRFCYIGCCIH